MSRLVKLEISNFSLDNQTGYLVLNNLGDQESRYSLIWFADTASLSKLAIPSLKICNNKGRGICTTLGLDDIVNLCICDSGNKYIQSFLKGLGYAKGNGICMYIDGTYRDKLDGNTYGDPTRPENLVRFIGDSVSKIYSQGSGIYDVGASSSFSSPVSMSSPPPPTSQPKNTLGGGMLSNPQNHYSYLLRNPEQDFLANTGNYLNPENNGIGITPSNTPWRE